MGAVLTVTSHLSMVSVYCVKSELHLLAANRSLVSSSVAHTFVTGRAVHLLQLLPISIPEAGKSCLGRVEQFLYPLLQ